MSDEKVEQVQIAINDPQPESKKTLEQKQASVILGIDTEGFLNVKVHVSLGKWNLWGVLVDAQNLVLGYFAQLRRREMQEEAKKSGLVRPDGVLKGFRNKWH